MYKFYLGGVQLPLTPERLKTKINGDNKTIRLADQREINLIKGAGLTEWEFEFDLPHQKYWKFVTDTNPAKVLDMLEDAKKNKKIVKFIIARKMGNSTRLSTNANVSIEDYTIDEDAENNSDYTISIRLKQFIPYRTKHMNIIDPKKTDGTINKDVKNVKSANNKNQRPSDTLKVTDNYNDAGYYTVKHGDDLYTIAVKYKVPGGYKTLYETNKKLLDEANSKYGTSKYTIYTGQKLDLSARKKV